MKKKVLVSVSTDPIQDYQTLIEYSKSLQGIADFLHCDVMDGAFVQQKKLSAQMVNNINANSAILLDVHLMCEDPVKIVKDYVKAGANIITLHYEAFKDIEKLDKCIDEIHANNALAGIAINPQTSVKEIKIFLYKIDLILVMSVIPGQSGQKFISQTINKIEELDKIRMYNNYNFKIEVDGGINLETAKKAVDAGADMLVSGSFVYNSKDRKSVIESLQGILK